MIVLKGFLAVEFDPPQVYEPYDVVIDGDEIIAAGADAAQGYEQQAEKVIEGSGKLLMPGLVCAHSHIYSAFSRGITASVGPAPDFVSNLKQLWWRLDRSLNEQAVYYSSLIACLDAVSCGTTAVVDHHASPSCIEGSLKQIRRGFEQIGVRGITGYEITDRNRGMAEIEEGIEENAAFSRQIDSERADGSWNGLVQSIFAAHAPFTVPDEGMALLKKAADHAGRGIHMHIAEDRYDPSFSRHIYGKDPLRRVDSFGLLNEKSVLVHGVHLTQGEIELMNDRDAFLVHNTRSNMNNAVGYNEHLPQAANLALGTDGIGANMFEEGKTAFFRHREARGPFGPGEILGMAAGGARLLSRCFPKPLGKLQKGYAADMVISDYLHPTPLVPENIAGHFIFAMGPHHVRTVLINGSVVMEDREFPFDTEGIYREARAAAQEVWKVMDTLSAHP